MLPEKKRKVSSDGSAKRTQEGDEHEYFEWIKRAFPRLFASFQSFKSARAFVKKMQEVPGRWEQFCASMDKCCIYTDPTIDRTKVMIAQNAVACVMCGCSNPKVPDILLVTCLKMTVPNRDGVPTLIRSKQDAAKLHAGLANVKVSKSFVQQAAAPMAKTNMVKKTISKKKKGAAAAAKRDKEIKAGVAKDAVMVDWNDEDISFYDDIVNLVEKATKGTVERRGDVIEQCVVYSLRYLLERSVRIPSVGKGGALEETLIQGDSPYFKLLLPTSTSTSTSISASTFASSSILTSR